MILIRLDYLDDLPGVMQFYGRDSDDAIASTIEKHEKQPSFWKRISPAEADAIRAARPVVQPSRPSGEAPNVFIGMAEADQQKVENIVAAIVETKVVDHRAELEALRDQLVRSEADRAAMAEKFAEIDALFDAIRQKAADFTGDQG